MSKRLNVLAILLAVSGAILAAAVTKHASARGGVPHPSPIVYVSSQGLFYDSIVLTDLPQHGRFQLLEMDGPPPNGLVTEFGPGDHDYVGGRWWVDVNGDGEMNDGDDFFLCPLLGGSERFRSRFSLFRPQTLSISLRLGRLGLSGCCGYFNQH
ncbi:MAG: hypothetical protein ACYTGF_17930 [Planctomycetota bacterium]